jgi:hypothetical protein
MCLFSTLGSRLADNIGTSEMVDNILAVQHGTQLVQNKVHKIQNFKLGQLAENGMFVLTSTLQCTTHFTHITMKHTHILISVRR